MPRVLELLNIDRNLVGNATAGGLQRHLSIEIPQQLVTSNWWFATVFVCCVFLRLGIDLLKLGQQFMEPLEFDLFLQQGFRVYILYL